MFLSKNTDNVRCKTYQSVFEYRCAIAMTIGIGVRVSEWTTEASAVSSIREYVFYVFFQISRKHDFLRFFEMTWQKKRKKSLVEI